MGYSNITDVERVLAQALTSATSSTLTGPTDLLNVGRVLDKNLVTEDIVNNYIRYADSEINGYLSVLYKVPVCEIVDFEGELFSNISVYNNFIVLEEYCPLTVGDTVLIIEGAQEERHIISEVIGGNTFETESEIQFEFSSEARILRVKYPDPLIIVSARMAAANIYDKYFASQSSPNMSEYGTYLREQAQIDINNVLNGTTVFNGQHRTGRRFYNANLIDQYGLPSGGVIPKDFKQIKK